MGQGKEANTRLASGLALLALLSACGGGGSGAGSDSPAAVTSVPNSLTPASLLAGQIGGPGMLDGMGNAARFDHPADVALDASGNVFVADYNNNTIRKIDPSGTVTTIAGMPGLPGSADGAGNHARFNHPQNIAVDSGGTLFVSDSWNNTIRKISPAGVVTTVAGQPGVAGSSDGQGSQASFNTPGGLAIDQHDDVFVTDSSNNTVREISPSGYVTTVAGTAGVTGSADGVGAAASFNMPTFITLDTSGNLYVADSWNDRIRKVSPGAQVTTVAGLQTNQGATGAFRPYGLSVDSSGDLLVADATQNTIRMITPSGQVSVVAGQAGSGGSADGQASAAQFSNPLGLALAPSGDLYVVDNDNNAIRKLSAGGVVSTFAGQPAIAGYADGVGDKARFDVPAGMAADAAGNIYLADCYNSVVRKISRDGTVTTLAGTPGQTGSVDGDGAMALFDHPTNLAVDAQGVIYVSDSRNNTVRKITPDGMVSTLAGSPGIAGSQDGTGSAAQFHYPSGIAVNASGTIYVSDNANHTIRSITPDGKVTTLAGEVGVPGSSDGAGATAHFYHPSNLVLDSKGNIFVVDITNNLIRRVTPAGAVSTIAGKASVPGSADGAGADARFNQPSALAIDAQDNLYVGDWYNDTVRKISTSDQVSTILGVAGESGVRLGNDPRPGNVQGLVVQAGKLYVSTANAVLWASIN